MSKSVLDKINAMIDAEEAEEEESAKPKNIFPFMLAITMCLCLILALCVISLVMNLSYDINVFLDTNMVLISSLFCAVMIFAVIAGFIGLSKGFKISKLLTILFSICGIILAVCPFVFALLY